MVKKCKSCLCANLLQVIDLGLQPIANNLRLPNSECPKIPLIMNLCKNCKLGQLSHFADQVIVFSDYRYQSSTSKTWLEHSSSYVNLVSKRLNLTTESKIIEVASNDGYLLNIFQEKKFKVLGIEPAKNIAKLSIAKGIPTESLFLSSVNVDKVISKFGVANLVIANNVLAHVPDIKDFAIALKTLLHPDGIITIENPSLLRLLKDGLFDTIYHEHYSYLSLTSVISLFNSIGLEVFDVENLETHGGSLRYWISHPGKNEISHNLKNQLLKENFSDSTVLLKLVHDFKTKSFTALDGLGKWINENQSNGRKLAGFGAAAKTTVVLNSLGASSNSFVAIADNGSEKQGYLVPGTDVPIVSPKTLIELNPSDILIFPWNLSKEILMNIRADLKLNCNVWVWLPEMQKL